MASTTGKITHGFQQIIAVDEKNVYFTTGDGKMMQVSKHGGTVLTLSTALTVMRIAK